MLRVDDIPNNIDVCATKTKQCITFDYLGYETAVDGITTLQFRITNHCNQKVKWVEIVSRQWKRIEPTKGAVYGGDLGDYAVTWIKDGPDHPKHNGYRFKPNFNTFQQAARETFSIQLHNFNSNRRIRVRAKVGNQIDRAGVRPSHFDCGSTPGPTPIPPNPQDICLSKRAGQVTFDFYGYVSNGNGSTTLTFGVTNPQPRKLDAIGFKAKSWHRLSPADQSTYTGSLGSYKVRWITHRETPNREAFRFKTQGAWFRHGAHDHFAMTVNNFDPTKRITAWIELGNRWIEVKARLSEHECDRTPPPTPTPTATPSPTPTATPTQPGSPLPTPTPIPLDGPLLDKVTDMSYVMERSLFAVELSEAEKQARWNADLPVPEIITVPLQSGVSQSFQNRVKAGLIVPIPQQTASGWNLLYGEDFESGDLSYPEKDGCRYFRITSSTLGTEEYQWAIDEYWTTISPIPNIEQPRSKALWPAAGGRDGVDPAQRTYPTHFVTDMVCTFENVQSFQNFMVEFQYWQDASATENDLDRFKIGFHIGEFDEGGAEKYYALSWRESWFYDHVDVNDHLWERRRIFYPTLAAEAMAVNENQNQVKVLWRFVSDGLENDADRGAWLDNINVEKYIEPSPPAGVSKCEDLDPTISVPGAVGPEIANEVSKGIVMDVDTEDDLPGRMARLTDIGTNWIRLEFKVNAAAFIRDTPMAGLDLKKHDELIDSLCASNMAVLGVIDYQSLASQRWRRFNPDGSPSDAGGVVSEDGYQEEFVAVTNFLTDYYKTRIGAWEIWNEPDYLPTRLRTDQYPLLLKAAYDAIKNGVDPDDRVLFGGLGGVNQVTYDNYFLPTYNFITANYAVSPFDIFALHPYSYEDNEGRLMVNPQEYLHYDWVNGEPRSDGYTPIRQFQTLLGIRQDLNKEIWITEIGWNTAKGDDAADNCPALKPQLVTTNEQAGYLFSSFDILFKETGWDATTPSVTKVFWYQYRDTGVIKTRAECGLDGLAQAAAIQSPSWGASYVAQYQSTEIRADADPARTPWWYGLYHGDFVAKPSSSAFKVYPPSYDFQVYLPLISDESTASPPGQ